MSDQPANKSQPILRERLDAFQQRVTALRERLAAAGMPAEGGGAGALAELQTALEELAVAEEELHQQADALGTAQLQVEWERARYHGLFDEAPDAWTDADKTTPFELGLGWMLRGLDTDDRAFIGRSAIERELATKSSRWKLSGLVVDWRDYDRIYNAAGLIPPKDHTPIQDEYYVYDDDLNQLGYATSQMYSPMLQRHIALARVPLDRTAPG